MAAVSAGLGRARGSRAKRKKKQKKRWVQA
jgi:hypothetical protein